MTDLNKLVLTNKPTKKNIECVEVFSGVVFNTTDKSQKIYVSTNVAESSITIESIKYVIDSGYELIEYYDPIHDANQLNKKFISQAQVKQRMGRAGRNGPGICYHLYTKEQFNSMIPFPKPTILNNDMYEECLKLLNNKNIGSVNKLKKIFNEFIEPPSNIYVDMAIKKLINLNLINDHGTITEMGEYVLQLRVDPKIGATYIYAFYFDCVPEVIMLFSLIEIIKGNLSKIFIKQTEENKEDINKVKKIFLNKYGDHLSLINIIINCVDLYDPEIENIKDINKWCSKYYINPKIIISTIKLYLKNKQNIIKTLISLKIIKNQVPESLSREKKILASIISGFKINIAYYNGINYDTLLMKNINLTSNSFINLLTKNKPNKIIYHDLFISNNKKKLIITSKIPTKIILFPTIYFNKSNYNDSLLDYNIKKLLKDVPIIKPILF